ncbi:response regulator [Desulfobacula toluolica]|uniref:Two component system response regulator modulated with antisigma-factor antagonist domain n=1 Tax=Desulfobacula toluolica (strain DSM 7467 / Tol2) TaxID=651182 RepID=K0NIA2_DESTT|nr:response regulator [Desulfobacula toluolica]CCK81096.1 two component system response regulator modulated with antisigma-factor antagonist domain [Desulfobacula toluolica Tol2]
MKPLKVLVIDDDKPTLNMFKLFLKAYGHDVLLAENGMEGIKLFETQKPAIVFTDIKMPGMDGFAVLDKIKGQAPETEVIIMTGHGDMDLAVDALNHEATDFINKPISRSALDAALHRAKERLSLIKTIVPLAQYHMEGNIRIIKIMGNINAAAEAQLMAAYDQAGAEDSAHIMLSFNENTSINGAGIAVLIQLLSKSKKKNQKVAVSGISENFQEIFKMVGITRFAKVFTSKADATSYLAAG